MDTNAVRYLSIVEGYQQYLTDRYVQGENTCMYSRTVSQTVESMKNAKLSIREQAAVGPINNFIFYSRSLKGTANIRKRPKAGTRFQHHMGRSCWKKFFLG
jgi:hypothetical protein